MTCVQIMQALFRSNETGVQMRCNWVFRVNAIRCAERCVFPSQRFECLRVGDRARLICMAQELLVSWPHQFADIARASRVSSSYLMDYRHPVPYWLHVAIRTQLFDQDYAPSKQERAAAKDYLLRHGGTGSTDEINGLLGVSSVYHKATHRERWNPRGPRARK